MQQLRAFWARSLPNKLVLVSVVGLLCCCPIAFSNQNRGTLVTPDLNITPGLATPAPATEAPAAQATVPAPTEDTAASYASGGLGLGAQAFEERYGAPTRESSPFVFYGDGLSVMYLDGRAWQIERSLSGELTVEEAREIARSLLPDDAEFIETYTSDLGQLVDRYRSESLIAQLPNDDWVGGEPGEHIVIYRRNEGAETTFGLVIGTGNNP